MNRPISGQFSTSYWDLQPGDTVEVDDANGTRYCMTGLAQPVAKAAAVESHWLSLVPEGKTACRHCNRYIAPDEEWLVRADEVPGQRIYRRPEHRACV